MGTVRSADAVQEWVQVRAGSVGERREPVVKIVLLCGEGAAARYLAHELHRNVGLDAIVVESGDEARARKRTRDWNSTPWWQTPLLGLDILALTIYERLWEWTVARRLHGLPAARGYPDGVPLDVVDEANDLATVFLLQELEPDVLVAYETSVLRPPVLSIPTRAALDIHSGIVPAYRNVHSELWAALNGDLDQIGCTVLHLDSGEGGGAIALEERLRGRRGFFEVRWENVRLGARLALEALRLLKTGELESRPHPASDAGFHPTPGFGALVRLAFKRVRLPG